MRTKRIPLAWQTFLAAILAIIIGKVWPSAAMYMGGFTSIFTRMLTLLAVPYIFIGIGSAITKSSDHGFTGRIILKNLSAFVSMEVLAIFTALLVSNVTFLTSTIELPSFSSGFVDQPREFGDFLSKFVPENIISAFSINNLPCIVLIACMMGYVANKCADRSRIFVTNMFQSVNDVMQRICDIVAALCPIGVFCIFSQITAEGSILASLYKVRPLITAALIALAIHSLVSIPIILRVSSKVSPFRLLKQFSNSLYTSMSFSSSTLAVPFAINRMKQDTGISPRISDFSMPVISVLNFNGSSIFLATAAIYVAQAYGINLSIIEQLILVFAVSFITIGTVACPLKLSIILFPVMESMGIPLEGMGVMALCELMMGMICSLVDTWSNIAITVNIAEGEGDKIKTEMEP